ncbi:MAG: ATP-dependent Clp protease proteolytic subunit [Micavibrio sp.]|nr:ATP-dependent Clp protease proteolytic subunit [Micavibrio sp.]
MTSHNFNSTAKSPTDIVERPVDGTPDAARLQYISSEGMRYFKLMQEAEKNGQSLDALFDVEGIEAMKKITASATGATGPVANRIVPTVTEVENGRERGYDLYSLLMKKRILLLEGQVDDGMASIACASLLYLNSNVGGEGTGNDPITVYVNSPGGSVLAGLAIYDTMRSIAAPIKTIGMGMQASMGSILLVAGDERKMTRDSYYMIHQPLSGNERSTQQTDIRIGADFTTRLREQLTDIYVRHTGLKHEFWDIVLERDTWLTAQNAKDMGIISDIIVGDRKKTMHEEFSSRAESSTARAKVPETMNGILKVINTANGADIRPDLVVALSKYEDFWTPSRKAEMAAKGITPLASNDDKAVPAAKEPKARKTQAPKA